MSHARAIFSNTVVQILGKVLTGLFGIIAIKILTSYLGKNLYGAYNTVYIYLSFFSIAADLGIYTIAVREMARKKDRIAEVFGNIISIRTALSLLAVSIACLVAFFIPQYRDSVILIGILISAVGTVISLINGVVVSIFQTTLKMQYSTLSLFVNKIVSVVGLVLVAFVILPQTRADVYSDTGFYLCIAVGIVSSIAMILTTLFYAKKLVHVSYRFDFVVWRELVRESFPFGIALILGTIYLKVDGFMLSLMSGNEAVGMYSAATKVIEVINVLPVMVMSTVLPIMTEYLHDKKDQLRELLKNSLSVLILLAFPIFVGMATIAYQIIATITTPEFLTDRATGFVGSDAALQILALALLFSFINNLFIYLLITIGQQKRLLWINASAVVINIILNLILIPMGGFVAASWTTVFSEVFVLVLTFYYGYQAIPFSIDWSKIVKILVSGVVMGWVLLIVKEPIISTFENKGIILLVIIGGFVYTMMIFLLQTFRMNDLRELIKKPS